MYASIFTTGSAPVVAVGNAQGGIDVFKIVGLDMGSAVAGAWDVADQAERLHAAISKGSAP